MGGKLAIIANYCNPNPLISPRARVFFARIPQLLAAKLGQIRHPFDEIASALIDGVA